MAYRQEYYFNQAEDLAEIVEVDLTVQISLGTFENCIKTREWSDLEPDAIEHKYYAPMIGLIRIVDLISNEEITLIDIQE